MSPDAGVRAPAVQLIQMPTGQATVVADRIGFKTSAIPNSCFVRMSTSHRIIAATAGQKCAAKRVCPWMLR
jgi:hypothetical protein